MLLAAQNLNFAYADRPTLRDISLAIAPGQTIALIGPNGSGKSTLIQCLLGHLPATGTITLEGRPISAWPRKQCARRVAYLAQSPSFEPGRTVHDVLRMGRAPYWSGFGLESAGDAGIIRDVSVQLELNDLLTRTMDQLSGGQRQRIFIARCLVQQPAILLLDEPDTYLDLRHQVELGRLIQKLAKEKNIGVLWASHDLNQAAAYADRLVLLRDGAIAAEGDAMRVLQADLLSEVYGVALDRIDRAGSPPIVVPRI